MAGEGAICQSFAQGYEIALAGARYAVVKVDDEYYLMGQGSSHVIGDSIEGLSFQMVGTDAAVLDVGTGQVTVYQGDLEKRT